MTVPIQPERNIVAEMRAALAGARQAGASPEQIEFLIGAWGREIENFNEGEQLAAGDPAPTNLKQRIQSGENPALAVLGLGSKEQLGGIAGLIKDVPGGEAAQAGVRGLVRGQPYGEALEDVRGAYESAPALARIPNRIVGGGIASAALPIKSPAYAGAAYGGLLNALSADPDQSLGERAGKTAMGAAVGGVVGKAGDMVATGIRAKLARPLGESLDDLTRARSEAAGPLYAAAEVEGAMAPATPEVAAFLARPDVEGIVGGLQQMDEFAGIAPEDPRMLDAIYKVLSDQQKTVGKGLAVPEPGKPNLGRFTERQIRGVKSEALRAMDPTMPSYRPATQAFAEGSRAIEGLKRGNNAAAIVTGSGSSPVNLQRFGPQALMDFLEGQGPDVSEQAAHGVLGFGRRKLEQAGPTGLLNPMRGMARNFLDEGGGLLRSIQGTAAENANAALKPATLLDYLLRAGTAAATPNAGRF